MKRKLLRLFYHVSRFLIGLLVYINGRLYMNAYNKLLKSVGIRLNGVPRFIAKSARFDDFELISIGDRAVISSNVILLTHDYSYTTSLISINEKPPTDIGILGPISIGENVFIGMNTLILPGSTIGNNVIIGAGSVIRGNIPDNSIFSGNPAVYTGDIREHAIKMKGKTYPTRTDKK
jgi:acetyltransferase-like isoleucine patch superfamily enzyme